MLWELRFTKIQHNCTAALLHFLHVRIFDYDAIMAAGNEKSRGKELQIKIHAHRTHKPTADATTAATMYPSRWNVCKVIYINMVIIEYYTQFMRSVELNSSGRVRMNIEKK